ncbi:MAG: UDP-N-acetylmuramoyl-L-alanine--D-glutamate ligase, partial [Clostridia bacterium]|nr:UDP-N-acetylmuramoyl-L-alanine--D-glutamate ligase [Clostridia bacterium]
DAAIKAIEAMKENIILIAGGYDKGSEYDEFIDAFEGRVKELLLIGVTAPKIRAAAEARGFTNIADASDMEECVKLAYEMAKPGDVVLLSPACASWDMYENFEQRGDHFKECALKL